MFPLGRSEPEETNIFHVTTDIRWTTPVNFTKFFKYLFTFWRRNKRESLRLAKEVMKPNPHPDFTGRCPSSVDAFLGNTSRLILSFCFLIFALKDEASVTT